MQKDSEYCSHRMFHYHLGNGIQVVSLSRIRYGASKEILIF